MTTVLQPALHMLSQNMTEKCRHREDEVSKMKEAVEQSCEVIADCRDECTSLTNAIAAIDKKLEQTKEVCDSCIVDIITVTLSTSTSKYKETVFCLSVCLSISSFCSTLMQL